MVRSLEFIEGGRGGTIKGGDNNKGKSERKNSDRGVVVLSGVWLWNSISWSVDRPSCWRLRIRIGRPGWVAVATIAIRGRVGCGAAVGVAGGVLAECRAWVWGRERGLGRVRTGS